MTNLFQTLPLLCAALAISNSPLHAQQKNPVIEEARSMAKFLQTGSYENSQDNLNRYIGGTQVILDAKNKTFRESYEEAKMLFYGRKTIPLSAYKIEQGEPEGESEQNRMFAQVLDRILPEPENANVYDEMLRENDSYVLLGRIFSKCYAAKKDDVLSQVFEKYYAQQTDAKIKEAMRNHYKRYYSHIIRYGEPPTAERAVAMVCHIKDDKLRQTFLEDIKEEVWAKLLNSLTDYDRYGSRMAGAENLLMNYYVIDSADWEKKKMETWLRFIDDVRDARKDSPRDYVRDSHPTYLCGIYLHLIEQYRKENPAATMNTDEKLRGLATGALESVKQSNDLSRYLYGIVLKYAQLDDKELLNLFTDLMLTTYGKPQGARWTISHVLTFQLLYKLERAEEANKMYGAALKLVDSEESTLKEKVSFLCAVADFYRQSQFVAETEALAKKVHEEVAILAKKEKKEIDQIDASLQQLVRYAGHTFVKALRECGDVVVAVRVSREISTSGHDPVLYKARRYADEGKYERAIGIGGAEGRQYGCSDSGIRGYTAHVMFNKGEKEQAEKLLKETIKSIESGKMSLHRDFIVGLTLCGQTSEAVRLSRLVSIDKDEGDWYKLQPDDYRRFPSLILPALLINDREEEAIKVIDDWYDDCGKAWGIKMLCRWNQEEYIRKGKASFFTPETKERWTKFLVNYADTINEPVVHLRVEKWNGAAASLIELGADKAAVMKILDKSLNTMSTVWESYNSEREGIEGSKYIQISVRVHTGVLLSRLDEQDKSDAAFVAAVRSSVEAGHIRDILSEYVICRCAASPEPIRTDIRFFSRYFGSSQIYSLRESWENHLFMTIMVV